ncbi:MAG: phage antirepressor N-terminal domain-containing protein [Cellulomonas sp.]|jgi:hypothetical protein|nr:phage antirepressor N-terminal domain-containing protein [Cellulomonas sp.]
MSTDLVRIPFHGGEVLLVDDDGRPLVVLRPFVETLGLTYAAQYRKLQDRSWATVAQRATVGVDGKTREHTVVDVRTALMLLATINENNVPEDRRPLLIAYQREVADAIETYWTKGGAVNPRADADQLAQIASLAQAQMAVLEAGRNLLPAGWLEAKAKIVASRALGEVPQVDATDMPLYVDTYLTSKGLGKRQVTALRSSFGRRLASVYRSVHGRGPGRAPATVDGRPREVNVYFGRDRVLFDQVWSDYYEEDPS